MIHKVTIFGCILQVVSDSMLAELKQCFLEAYDDNNDGKIDIREVKTITNIFFCYLFGIHLHLLQKKLYRLLDTAAITFIHHRRVRAKKPLLLQNPKPFSQLGILQKVFSCIFYFSCFYSGSAILL